VTTRLFGEGIARREDPRLLRGEGRYVDDLGAGALEVAFIRSPHAHARITGIDVSRALDVDGLVAVYTYDDLPDRIAEPLPLLIPHQALTEPRTAYCLAKEVVRHVGEPVAMVVATDRYIAEDAAERIDVTYEPRAARAGGGAPPPGGPPGAPRPPPPAPMTGHHRPAPPRRRPRCRSQG
jgi:aerobic carbon-monoxide dehydrogenase large subunit